MLWMPLGIKLGALSWQPKTYSLHGLGKTIGWGKTTLLRVTTTHLGAIGTESTAIEKTSFLFMPIVMAGMFCLYQHAALDYLNFFLLPTFSSYCLYLIKI